MVCGIPVDDVRRVAGAVGGVVESFVAKLIVEEVPITNVADWCPGRKGERRELRRHRPVGVVVAPLLAQRIGGAKTGSEVGSDLAENIVRRDRGGRLLRNLADEVEELLVEAVG